jgi:hypothetical protein
MTGDLLGTIDCNFDNILNKLNQSEYIQLDFQPSQIVQMNTRDILISSFDDDLLALYDADFNFMRKIHKINGENISPTGLACDKIGNIFMGNGFDGSLIKVNNKFELVCQTGENKDYGDIHIHNDRLYVCERTTNAIEVLSLDLEHMAVYPLDYEPCQTRIINDTVCVLLKVTDDLFFTSFYKSPSFELIAQTGYSGTILAHDKMFYIYKDTGFMVFGQTGEFIDKKKTNFENQKYCEDGIIMIDDVIYVCIDDKKLCKIKISP